MSSSATDPSTFPSLFDNSTDNSTDNPTDDSTDDSNHDTIGGSADGFAALGVPEKLVRALAREGIVAPFEIQAATVPDALAGRDVLGRGQTGSGKTLAFGLPMLARLAGRASRARHPRGLVLVPTRELAMQVADALRPLARAADMSLAIAVGGMPYDRQIDALRRGLDLLVATPGRLDDLIERGACALDDVEITVLDEADQMADLGFLPDVTALLERTPGGGQRLLFSATLDSDVDALVKRFLIEPVTHSTDPPAAAVSTMDHHVLLIPPGDKFGVAASIAARTGRTIMFARTQAGVDRLVEQLAAVGVRAGALHGGKTQRIRTRTLTEFREGRMGVLVATDVAARGIHVDGVSLVVHVDPPRDAKAYLHRAGRTARAGEAGVVAMLVLPKQRKSILAMLDQAGVAPAETRVRSGAPALVELTGAREPSGVPVVEEPEPVRRPRSDGGQRRSRWRAGRPGQPGRDGQRDKAEGRNRGGAHTGTDRRPERKDRADRRPEWKDRADHRPGQQDRGEHRLGHRERSDHRHRGTQRSTPRDARSGQRDQRRSARVERV